MNDSYNQTKLTTIPTTDRQTGLPTLLSFYTDLHSLLECNTALALIVFYIDGIVKLKKCLGDEAAMVQIIARLAGEAIRPYPGAHVYRTATDSFSIVLPQTNRPAAMQLAEMLRQRIQEIGQGITGTFAVGSAPQDAGQVGALIAVCEAPLLYAAQMRNRVYVAQPVESLPPTTAHLVNLMVARIVTLIAPGQQLSETEQRVSERRNGSEKQHLAISRP